MEFKKCVRCGCFFISNDSVCCNCESRDRYDIAKINDIIEENEDFGSIEELSNITGVNINNITRFISNNKINGIDNISF